MNKENKNIGGSFKNQQYELYILNRLEHLFPNRDARILDVGVGAGKYGILLKEYSSVIDGIEAFEKTLKLNTYLPQYYNEIFVMNVLDFDNFKNYDVVIFGDVLEHIKTEDAQRLLSRIYNEVSEIIILVPFLYEQDALNDNPYEIHQQPDLTHEIFLDRYKGFECWGLNKQQGIYMKKTSSNIVPTTHKNKVAVYTICKNEINYVNSFMDSMSEADAVFVLDTGSTDGTVEKLRERGAIVFEKIINPWDFSKARNAALKLVPKEFNVLVSVDLDEVFHAGWATWLRENWQDEMGMIRYFYVSTHQEDGSPGVVFYRDKIHLNDYNTYYWKYSIHEVLARPSNQPVYYTNNIICHHYQNLNTNRKNYLDLLKKEYQKKPKDVRNIHLLGREYFIYEQYEECIDVLSNMRQFEGLYVNEVADAYTYIGKSYHMLGDLDQAAAAFKRGTKAAPHLRGSFLDLANIYIQQGRFGDALLTIGEALKITKQYLL